MKTKYKQPKVGMKYGRLVVTDVKYGKRGGIISVKCQCTCGKVCYPKRDSLVTKLTIACPSCAHKIAGKKIAKGVCKYPFIPKKHRRRIQYIVYDAIGRCHTMLSKHHKQIKNYRLRDISVCKLWRNNKQEFAKYLLTLPGWDNPNLVIDRIDNDGNYEPGNLRFVTRSVSNLNRRPFWYTIERKKYA